MIEFLRLPHGLWWFPLFLLWAPFTVSASEGCAARGAPGTRPHPHSFSVGLLLQQLCASPTRIQAWADYHHVVILQPAMCQNCAVSYVEIKRMFFS